MSQPSSFLKKKETTRDNNNVPRITTISVKIEEVDSSFQQISSSKSCTNIDLPFFNKSINGTNVNYTDILNDDLASCLGTTSGPVKNLSYLYTSQSGTSGTQDYSCTSKNDKIIGYYIYANSNNICRENNCSVQSIEDFVGEILFREKKKQGNTLTSLPSLPSSSGDGVRKKEGFTLPSQPSLQSSSGDDVSIVKNIIHSNFLYWLGLEMFRVLLNLKLHINDLVKIFIFHPKIKYSIQDHECLFLL